MPEGPVNDTVGGANTTKVLSNWAEQTRLSSPWTYSTDLVTSNTVESAMTSNDVWLLGTSSNSRPVVAKKEYDVLSGESPSFKSKKSTAPPSQKTGATVNSGATTGSANSEAVALRLVLVVADVKQDAKLPEPGMM